MNENPCSNREEHVLFSLENTSKCLLLSSLVVYSHSIVQYHVIVCLVPSVYDASRVNQYQNPNRAILKQS